MDISTLSSPVAVAIVISYVNCSEYHHMPCHLHSNGFKTFEKLQGLKKHFLVEKY